MIQFCIIGIFITVGFLVSDFICYKNSVLDDVNRKFHKLDIFIDVGLIVLFFTLYLIDIMGG